MVGGLLTCGKVLLVESGIFPLYYLVFLTGLELTASDYIERAQNLEALSGITVAGFPIEEFLFAIAFGAYWSDVYKHLTWRRVRPAPP